MRIVATGGLETPLAWLASAFGVQITMYILCLIFAAVEVFRGDRGLHLGFVLTWALGVVTLLMLGCCVYGYAVADGDHAVHCDTAPAPGAGGCCSSPVI